MKNVYQKYQNQSVQTASREKLLLMLYEGAIKFVKKAVSAIEAKDIAARGMNIGRAYDIILELNNTLTQANIRGDAKPLEEVLKILEILYQGWVEAIEKLKKENVNT